MCGWDDTFVVFCCFWRILPKNRLLLENNYVCSRKKNGRPSDNERALQDPKTPTRHRGLEDEALKGH